jgi:hypothetical protein
LQPKRNWIADGRLGSRTDKTHSEHNESGYPPLADIRADIAFRRLGAMPRLPAFVIWRLNSFQEASL